MAHKSFATLAVLAGSTLSMVAQVETSNPPIAYGYNHTIELALGSGHNLKSYTQLPDQGVALFGDDVWGVNFSFRYSRFFGQHWGAFAQISCQSLGADYFDLEDHLARQYNHNGKETRYGGEFVCGFGNDFGSYYHSYLLGPVYRYDVGRWSFRPRFGIGLMRQFRESVDFFVVDTRTDCDYERVEFSTVNHLGKADEYFNAFAYSPSMQVTFSVGTHFFFSAEAQWIGTIGHLYQRTVVKQYRADEPQTWQPERDGYFYINGDSKFVRNNDDILTRVQMGNFMQFRLGLGWNIGHNQNAKRRVASLY